MDPRIDWSCLPEELVVNILSRLPLIELQKLRIVCKAWNDLAISPELLRCRATLSCSRPGFALFLTSEEASEMLYLDLNDPHKWRTISFSFLPSSGALKFLASSGGLLLLGRRAKDSAQGGDLLVVNPITKQWRVLPRAEVVRDFFYTALWADEEGEFVVVIAESELRDAAATEVFCSSHGIWRQASTPSKAGRWKRVAATMSTPWFYGSVPVYCKPVYCEGAFYHLTWDPEDMVAEFRVKDKMWRCAKGRGAVPGGVPWGVMEVDGKVLLVEMSDPKAGEVGQVSGNAAQNNGSDGRSGGKAGHSGGAAAESDATAAEGGGNAANRGVLSSRNRGDDAILSLWELQREKLEWVRSAQIPPPPLPEYRIDRWRRFAVGDGFVCTTFLISGTIVTFASQSDAQRGMLFDVAHERWLPMPDLPGTPWGHISSLFSFDAALHPLPQPSPPPNTD